MIEEKEDWDSDAVIGYFVAENNSLLTTANAVNCAKSMISVIQKGINPIFAQLMLRLLH